MDKYLKQLLEAHAKVILPSFGAIVVENEETGNLMFNEYLSYNDGKLDNLIVSESNMDLQEAQNMIAKYVRDIQVQIDKGESYDIFKLGRFYKNEDGDIEFEGNLKNGPSKSSSSKAAASKSSEEDKKKDEAPKAKEEKKETKPESKKEEPKKEEKVDSKSTKDTKSDSKSTPKENKFVANKEKEETKAANEKSKTAANNKKEEAKANKAKLKAEAKKKKEEAKANKAKLKAEAKKKKEEAKANKAKLKAEAKKKKEEAKKGAKSSDKTKTPDKAKATESPKADKVKNKKTPKDPKEPKKKKRFGAIFWVIIVILALVSAGLIYVGLNYQQVKTYMGWNKFEEEKVASKESNKETKKAEEEKESIAFDANENTAADTTEASNVEFDEEGNVVEEKQEVEEKTAPKPEPSPVTTSSKGTHHLIAGSFSNKSNAEGLVEDLKSKGLNARILGQFGGLHFVAAESYNSSKEAQADLSRVRQHAEGAWIFKYNDN